MTAPSFLIRPMQPADLPEVLRIQAACFEGQLPESAASLAAKLHAAPAHCWVAESGARLAAYLFSLPWRAGAPPALDAAECVLPADPDCLYLHDLSVHPQARGSGLARDLVQVFLGQLRELGLGRAGLIAVQNSSGFWQRWGFEPAALTPELHVKLASYGLGAEYLERTPAAAGPAQALGKAICTRAEADSSARSACTAPPGR